MWHVHFVYTHKEHNGYLMQHTKSQMLLKQHCALQKEVHVWCRLALYKQGHRIPEWSVTSVLLIPWSVLYTEKTTQGVYSYAHEVDCSWLVCGKKG